LLATQCKNYAQILAELIVSLVCGAIKVFGFNVNLLRIMKKTKPKIISVKTVAQSRLFKTEAVELEFANGAQTTFERLCGSGAVMVIAVHDDHVYLIKEYAVGVEKYLLGFVKGRLETGESPETGANREIQEEIGFAANKLEYLRSVAVAPGYTNFHTHIVIASDLYASVKPGDEPEQLEVVKVPVQELDSLMQRDDFIESRSLLGLYLLKDWLAQSLPDSKI